jgi:epoxyqueuosine reductase QueG
VTDELWIPLVDESIGEIVAQLEGEHEELRMLVDSPQKLLAFRTFANIRVGMALGRQLVERDLSPGSEDEPWVQQLAREPDVRAELVQELRELAEQLAEEDETEAAEPDAAARERFRSFARRTLEA